MNRIDSDESATMSLWRNPTAWIVFVFGLVLLAGVAAYNREELQLRLDAWRIDTLLEDYTATRDEHLAGRLAKLLEKQRLDRATGDAVLTAITEPIIYLRDGYRRDRVAYVTWTHPHPLSFGNDYRSTDVDFSGTVRITNSCTKSVVDSPNVDSPNVLKARPYHCFLIAPVNSMTPLRVRPHDSEFTLSFQLVLRENKALLYESMHRRRLEYRIVEVSDAEEVQHTASPSDAPVVAVSTHWQGRMARGNSGTYVIVRNPPLLRVEATGAATCFRVEFETSAGEVIEVGDAVRLLPGEVYEQRLPKDYSKFNIGKYSGTLRLIPDSDLAYDDSRLKSMWGERIELPLEFAMEE